MWLNLLLYWMRNIVVWVSWLQYFFGGLLMKIPALQPNAHIWAMDHLNLHWLEITENMNIRSSTNEGAPCLPPQFLHFLTLWHWIRFISSFMRGKSKSLQSTVILRYRKLSIIFQNANNAQQILRYNTLNRDWTSYSFQGSLYNYFQHTLYHHI